MPLLCLALFETKASFLLTASSLPSSPSLAPPPRAVAFCRQLLQHQDIESRLQKAGGVIQGIHNVIELTNSNAAAAGAAGGLFVGGGANIAAPGAGLLR